MLLTKKQSSKKFLLRIHVTLRSPSVSIEVIDSASFNWEFRLHCRSRSFILYAAGEDDRTFWAKDLERSIKGTHDEEKKVNDKETGKIPEMEVHAPETVTKKRVPPTNKPLSVSADAHTRVRANTASDAPKPGTVPAFTVTAPVKTIPKKKAAPPGKPTELHVRSSPGIVQNESAVHPVPFEGNTQTGIFLYPNPMTTNNPFLDVPPLVQNPFATNTFTQQNAFASNSPFAPNPRMTMDPNLLRNMSGGGSAFGTYGTGPMAVVPANNNPFATNPNVLNPFATTPNPASNPFVVTNNPNPFATTPNPSHGNPFGATPTGRFF